MALPKQKFREIVLQLLFSNFFYKIEKEDFIYTMMQILKTTKKNIKEAYELVLKIEEMEGIKNYVNQFKEVTDDRFIEIDSSIRRLTHIMRVKPSERNDAAERYDSLEELQE